MDMDEFSNEDIYLHYELEAEIRGDVVSTALAGYTYRPSVIPKTQYKKALDEFVRFGKIFYFPVKKIHYWKRLTLKNILLLEYITDLLGHNCGFDNYDFCQRWLGDEELNLDWDEAMEIMDEKGWTNLLPMFSNGHFLISDYGLRPLQELSWELLKEDDPDKILVLINRVLDVTHPRSDLAELFIEGGSGSLDFISYGNLQANDRSKVC